MDCKMIQSRRLFRILLALSSCTLLCLAFDATTTESIASDSNITFVTEAESSTSPASDSNFVPVTSQPLDANISITTTSNTNESSLGIEDTSTKESSTEELSTFPTLIRTTVINSREASKSDDLILTTIQPESTTSDVLRKWLAFENITKIYAKDIVKMLLPLIMEGTGDMNISASCQRDTLKFIAGIRDIKTWAFSFLDASAKVVDGMLSGTMASMGEYDQCMDIKVTNERKGKKFGQVMFTGQYCALDLKPPLPPKKRYYKLNDVVDELKEFSQGGNIINEAAKAAQFFHFLTMRLGICVPSGCQPSDLQQVVDKIYAPTYWTVNVKWCEVKQENEYTPLIIGVMTVSCFFGFLLIVGSLIDLYHKYAQKKISNVALEILVSFSFPSNFKKLINTKSPKSGMNCLHGFRFLSISWIVLGHTYLNVNYILSKTLKNATLFQKDFFFQAVVNASVAVDTFFFIGGLLVCYGTVKVIKETKKPFSIVLYILHRVFRLLPVYLMVIAFIFLAPIMGSGPIFHDTLDPFMESCYKNWWTNIIFVNNYVNTNQICLPQSWYIACDMQLYVAALLVVIPILRWPWVGLSIASLGIVASVLGTMAMTYIYEYPPTMLFVHPDIEQRTAYWANAYFKPYSHAGPYCIGLIMGYILATHPKLKFSMVTRVIGWALAIACNMSVLYGVHAWNSGKDPELVETLLYSGLHRVAWTFGVAWIVLNSFTGQGGVVSYILSWRVWIPLGRLTYAIYLIHPIVQIATVANIRTSVQTTHYFAVWIFFGYLMATIGCAFAASMLVEAPFIQLEKLLLRALAGKPQSNQGYTNGNTVVPSNSTDPESVNSVNQGYTNGHTVVPSNSTEPKRVNSYEGTTVTGTRQRNGTAQSEPVSHL